MSTGDQYSREELLRSRKIVLVGDIDEFSIKQAIQDLLILNYSKEDVFLYLCSPGGFINTGLALIDIMDQLQYDINTIVMGECASMAAVIALCGKRGKRWIMPKAKLMFHKGHGEMEGNVDTIKSDLEEFQKMENLINKIVAKKTGKTVKSIKKDIESKDFWLNAKGAIAYKAADGLWTLQKERKSNKYRKGNEWDKRKKTK